jgi:hypothetical protein
VETYTPGHDKDGYYKEPAKNDELDLACKHHDICYYKCRRDFPCSVEARGACMTRCDRVLGAESERITLPPTAGRYERAFKPALEAWMNKNNSPDPGANALSCDMPQDMFEQMYEPLGDDLYQPDITGMLGGRD